MSDFAIFAIIFFVGVVLGAVFRLWYEWRADKKRAEWIRHADEEWQRYMDQEENR